MKLTICDGAKSLLDFNTYRIAKLWKIVRRDGWIRRYTSHNRSIEFMGETFYPTRGASGSASHRETGFKGQNFEAIGIISDEDITAEDLANNKFDGARVYQWLVDWKFPFFGYFNYAVMVIKDHDFDGSSWKAQVEGPAAWLEQSIGDVYDPTCRRRYGEIGCNRIIDTESAALRSQQLYDANGTPTTMGSVHGHPQEILNEANQLMGWKDRWMKITGVRVATPPVGETNSDVSFYLNTSDIANDYASNDPTAVSAGTVDLFDLQAEGGWFTYGTLTFDTGVLASTLVHEIHLYEQPYTSPYIKVTLRVPQLTAPSVGDTVTLIAGCNRSMDHCRLKNGNQKFFGGFIFIPGPDAIYQRPGSI